MRRIVPAGVFVAAVVALVGARVALATPQSGLIQTFYVTQGRFDPIAVRSETDDWELELLTKAPTDLWVVKNELPLNAHTGWHTHPGPSLITVTKGTITAYDADCVAHEYPAGTGFVDPGGAHVHILINRGTVAAETVAVQLLARNSGRRIDAPAPANCPVP